MLGTRLRTRMLWGAVLVSLVPLIFMFFFSYLLMNRAVDRAGLPSQGFADARRSRDNMASRAHPLIRGQCAGPKPTSIAVGVSGTSLAAEEKPSWRYAGSRIQ